MMTAIVRYKLPPTIGRDECLARFHKIGPSFANVKGLIRKQFIWGENGVAGGVYQWESLTDAKPSIRALGSTASARYGADPTIEFYTTFAVTENPGGKVTYTEPRVRAATNTAAA